MVDYNILILFIVCWTLTSIIDFIIIQNLIDIEFRKFYLHPSYGAMKHIEKNKKDFSKPEEIIICCSMYLLYIPITIFWILCWFVVRLFVYINDKVSSYYDVSNKFRNRSRKILDKSESKFLDTQDTSNEIEETIVNDNLQER